jgi:hypothetical protein
MAKALLQSVAVTVAVMFLVNRVPALKSLVDG